jgi:acyl carrier protein
MSKMSSTDEKLKNILMKVLLIDKNTISDNMSRKKVEEWDSMAQLMLVSEIESAFNVVMSDEDIMEIQTVGDIKRVLKKLGRTIR